MNNKARRIEYKEKYDKEFPIQWFRYCKDPLESIEGWNEMLNDASGQRWHIHHRDEISEDGVGVHSDELKDLKMYYHLAADKLIFMTAFDHLSLHRRGKNNPMHGKPAPNKGKPMSEETKKKLSENSVLCERTGEKNPNSKKIKIDGVTYCSCRAAAKALEKCNNTITRWLKEGKARSL